VKRFAMLPNEVIQALIGSTRDNQASENCSAAKEAYARIHHAGRNRKQLRYLLVSIVRRRKPPLRGTIEFSVHKGARGNEVI
jgi:hypothetical protein